MKRLVVLLAAASLIAGCGGGGSKKDATTTTTTTPTATTAAGTTNTTQRSTGTGAGAPVTTASTAPVQRGEVDPIVTAENFIQAWEDGNATEAQRLAEPQAVSILFKTSYDQSNIEGLRSRGCNPNSAFQGQMTCSYEYDSGSMHFIMLKTGSYYTVKEVAFADN
jgi:hypothetical protein